MLAQNQKPPTKVLNSKIRRLQSMLEMRKLIIEGHSYNEIQDVLGLSKRTFYRYLSHAFQEDKKALEAQNTQQVMFHLTVLENRYNSILQELNSIATDKQQSAEDRMNALHAMASLSLTIAKLHRDAPLISIIENRKLKAIKEGGSSPLLYFRGDDSLFLPSIYRGWRQLPDQLQQQEQQDDNNNGNGDGRNEKE